MAGTVHIKVAKFDGKHGPVQAQNFINKLESVMNILKIDDGLKADFFLTHLEPNSPADLWASNKARLRARDFKKYTYVKAQFEQRYFKPLTLAQNVDAMKKLKLGEAEDPGNFFEKIVNFCHNKDFHLSATEREEDGYERAFNEMVKSLFLQGLPSTMLDKMSHVDQTLSSGEDLLSHAMRIFKNTQLLKPATPAVNAFAMQRGRGGYRGRGYSRGRGRGGQRGGGYGNRPPPSSSSTSSHSHQLSPAQLQYRKDNKPSKEVLAARANEVCNRCNQLTKHRGRECFVSLDAHGRPLRKGKPVNELQEDQQYDDQYYDAYGYDESQAYDDYGDPLYPTPDTSCPLKNEHTG